MEKKTKQILQFNNTGTLMPIIPVCVCVCTELHYIYTVYIYIYIGCICLVERSEG